MTKTKSSPFLSVPVRQAVSTDADTESPVTRHQPDEGDRAAWEQIIDGELIAWGCAASEPDDEGMIPPSRKTIQLAIQLAGGLSKSGQRKPTRVVPDAHGGIVFERRDAEMFETLRISADETVDHCIFNNGLLVLREAWDMETSESD